jgi:hypothetical protein
VVDATRRAWSRSQGYGARHAAAIRLLNGQPITEGGFDKSLEQQAVLDAVKPFVKS